MGLAPNNSRARPSSARTSSSCCCSAESAMATRYPGQRGRTIHRLQRPPRGCRYAEPVAIFGRKTARERLRRATRESLAMPAFSSPIDCTPWVVGGLWPAELSTITDENATLAEHLRDDLQRIISRTNDELKLIKRAGMDDGARHAAESRVIDEAHAHAVRRVESAVRHLHTMKVSARPQYARHPSRQVAGRYARRDHDQTQVLPAVPAPPPPAVKEPGEDKTEVIPAVPVFEPVVEELTGTEVQPVPDSPVDDEDAEGGRHRISGADDAAAETAVIPVPQGPVEVVEAEPETTRLQGLAAFEEEAEPEAALPVDDDEIEAAEGQLQDPGDD